LIEIRAQVPLTALKHAMEEGRGSYLRTLLVQGAHHDSLLAHDGGLRWKLDAKICS
jgi:hypothetical protein